MIESGHFRFHVVGERILHLDARLFYKHRGLERAAEGQTLDDGLAYATRACAACAVANGVAYAHACEDALGLAADAELARVRTILLELERMWSHLNDIAAVCAGVGLAAGNNHFAALTERARRLNAKLTGHRFLFGTVASAAATSRCTATTCAPRPASSPRSGAEARRGWRELLFNRSFQDRLPDIGVVDAAAAATARRGRPCRARRRARRATSVRAARGSPTTASSPSCRSARPATCRPGSSSARSSSSRRSSCSSACSTAASRPAADDARSAGAADRHRPGREPARRDELHRRAQRRPHRAAPPPHRARTRTGPSVAYAAADNLLPDFPLINKSFELCYACADR